MLADTAARIFKRYFNIFDLVNTLIAILDIAAGDQVPLFRALRIFRLFKLIQANQELQKWIMLILYACKASPLLLFVLLLVMFIFSTFTIQLLGGKFCGLNTMGDYPVNPSIYMNTTWVSYVDPTNVSNLLYREVQEQVIVPSLYNGGSCDELPG